MSDQKVVNTLWIVVPALMAVVISARGGAVEVVRQGLPVPPVALATDRRPASADGFFWQVSSSPGERLFRSRDGRTVRLAVPPDETILWSRQVGDAVYSLAGHGPDRSGPPCVIDPPFVLRRASVNGGPARIVHAGLPSTSVFVTPSGSVCFADRDGVHRIPAAGGKAALICPRPHRNVTAWGQRSAPRGETLYWIEEAMPGGRDPIGSCRLVALAPGASEPQTVAWAPDALTDLVVSEEAVAWYHPAGRAIEGVRPDGRVTVLARDVNLAATPEAIGDQLFYLCERRAGARELATTSISEGGRETLARLDGSARLLGAAHDGLYLSEADGSRGWFSRSSHTGRLLRVPLP